MSRKTVWSERPRAYVTPHRRRQDGLRQALAEWRHRLDLQRAETLRRIEAVHLASARLQGSDAAQGQAPS